jgi:hypothetical protein
MVEMGRHQVMAQSWQLACEIWFCEIKARVRSLMMPFAYDWTIQYPGLRRVGAGNFSENQMFSVSVGET